MLITLLANSSGDTVVSFITTILNDPPPKRNDTPVVYDGKNMKALSQNISPGDRGVFKFIPFSLVQVSYDAIDSNDLIMIRWSITNFEFVGNEKSHPMLSSKDKFNIRIAGLKFNFLRIFNYDQLIIDAITLRRACITSEAEVITQYEKTSEAYGALIQCCWLLSFLTSNWVMPSYSDCLRNGKIVQSIIYPMKIPYEFIKGKYIVDIHDTNFSIDDFIEKAYTNYETTKTDFEVEAIIEYYLSAIRQKTPEAEFLVAMIGLECVSSSVPEFATKSGDNLVSKDMESKKEKISDINKKRDLKLDYNSIEEISKAVSSANIGIKDNLRYLFGKLNMRYDENDLKSLISIRGKLIHSGKYEDLPTLLKYRHVLLNLLVTILLRLLGWKGDVEKLRYKLSL